MKQNFDVFLSHNSRDKPIVEELGELLKLRGLTVWLDKWELVPGRPWQEALEEVIGKTRSAAVLVGREGVGPWQQPEMRAALSQFVKKGLPVIPVLLPNAPLHVELPLFLENFTWVDFRSGFSKEAIDRLVWGITGSKPGNESTEKPYAEVNNYLGNCESKQISEFHSINGLKFIHINFKGWKIDIKDIQRTVNKVAELCGIGWDSRGDVIRNVNMSVRSNGFFIGETCITNKEYWDYVKSVGITHWPRHWKRSAVSEHGFPFAPIMATLPVVNVSFAEAQAFARYIGARLPTTEERTLTVCGAFGDLYPWGNDYNPEYCNGKEGGRCEIANVTSYLQGNTAEGVRQLSGNVWEWVLLPNGTPAVGGGSYLDPCEYWGIGYVYQKMNGNECQDNIGFRILCNKR